MLGLPFQPKEDYSDIGNGTDNSNFTFPFTDQHLYRLAEAMDLLGCKSYYRFYKGDAFRRSAACDPNDPFINLELVSDVEDECDDHIVPNNTSESYLQNITTVAPDQFQGFYTKLPVDYFFEWQHPTPLDGTVIGLPHIVNANDPSDCRCRNFFSALIDGNSFMEDGVSASLMQDIENLEGNDHYLCINCIDWQKTTYSRYRKLASEGADALFCDVRHSPFKQTYADIGCTCQNCVDYFNNTYCPQSGLDNCNLFLGMSQPGNEGNVTYQRRMSDFMSHSLINFFDGVDNPFALNKALHEFGAVGIVSVAHYVALSYDDHHRSELLARIDIPKVELNNIFRAEANSSFYDPTPANALLSTHRIPEDIRLGAALGIFRDASKFRLGYIWMPSKYWLSNDDTNNSVLNNKRLKTYLGIGLAHGSIMSTSLTNTSLFDINANAISFQNADNRLWNLSSYSEMSNPFEQQITPIFLLAEHWDKYFNGTVPYDWVAVHFSETERNNQFYMPGSGIHERRRDMWLSHLLPLHGAYQAISNYPVENDLTTTCIKYPVTFINDFQLSNHETRGLAGIVVPIPATAGANANPLDAIDITVRDVIEAAETNDGIEIMYAYRNNDWFKTAAPTEHHDLLTEIRDQVIQNVGIPPIFVTGHSMEARMVQTGFFYNHDEEFVTVAFVVDPMFSLGVRDDDWDNTVALSNTEVSVNQGDLVIHINKNGFFTNNICPLNVTVADTDPATLDSSFVVESNSSNFEITVPAFRNFLVIKISSGSIGPDGSVPNCYGILQTP